MAGAAIAVGIVGAYIVARAIEVPLSYDEAASFIRYIDTEPSALFDFFVATNHLLNSLLTKLSWLLFGPAPWALRLPNVLAGGGYLACATALAFRARSAAVGIASLVLLTTNPYLLEYFALSRGYGLAAALLAGSLLALIRWFEHPIGSAASSGFLRWTLWLAAAAVAANFAALTAFVAIASIAALRLVVRGRSARPTLPEAGRGRLWTWRAVGVWVLVSLIFSGAVYARDRVLSPSLFSPIAVRVSGLFEDEQDQIRVFRIDAQGRPRELARSADNVWRTGSVRDAWGLRVYLPEAIDRNLSLLEVRIGDRRFVRDRRTDGPWTMHEASGERQLESTADLTAPRSAHPAVSAAVNWVSDSAHLRLVAKHAAVTVGVLAAVGGMLLLVLDVLVGRGLMPRAEARSLGAASLAVGSLAATPLYLLRLNGQLYFGGSSGLLDDTFGSLLRGTAYGAAYTPEFPRAVLIGLAAVAALAALPALLTPRTRRDVSATAALVPLGVLVLVCAGLAVQYHWLGTPYLTGRTALYLLIFVLIFIVQAAETLSRAGRAPRVAVIVTIWALAAASVWHLGRTANLSHTFDWPDDSATPDVLATVARDASAGDSAPPVVRLGVQWMYYPVARYYADRLSTAATRFIVDVVPDGWPPYDYIYGRASSGLGEGAIVETFPTVGAVLWKARADSSP